MSEVKNLLNQYIIFNIAKETFAISISLVKEVINLNAYHKYQVPGAPQYFEGVINLRGQVIPILHAKAKLDFALETPMVSNPKVIIIEYNKENFGLLVDDVEEVKTIDSHLIENAPGHLGVLAKDQKIGRISGKDNDKDRFVFILSKESLFENIYDKEDHLIGKSLHNLISNEISNEQNTNSRGQKDESKANISFNR
ncbi:MAG TPA: chemotaxis protein CheW [Vampirovibrionales bacterium]